MPVILVDNLTRILHKGGSQLLNITHFNYIIEDMYSIDCFSYYLNEFRINLTSNLVRSRLMRSYGYALSGIAQDCSPDFP